MILVLCNLITGDEQDYVLPPRDTHKTVLLKQYEGTHRIWQTVVVCKKDGIYEISEDYYFLVLSLAEIEHIKKVQRGESIVHHMEFKLRNKNLMGLRGKVTALGCRVIKAINQFDKSIKQY